MTKDDLKALLAVCEACKTGIEYGTTDPIEDALAAAESAISELKKEVDSGIER